MSDPATIVHLFGIPITLTPWKYVGLSGSLIFGLRFIVQAVASERAKKSVIPFGFWELSALGSFLTVLYFIFGKSDSVGLINGLLPLPIYLRNLYFRYTDSKEKPEVREEVTVE